MKPTGIGGWLILPAIGLVLSPILLLVMITRDLLPALQPEVWHALTEPGSQAYHPMWATVIVFEVVANVGFLIFTLRLGYLFVRKSSRTPTVFIAWLLINVAIQVVDLLLVQSIPAVAEQSMATSAREVVRAILQALIWIPYFLRSERVRNTFTLPLKGAVAPAGV